MNKNKIWSDVLAYRPLINLKAKENKIIENQLTEDKNEMSTCLMNYLEFNPYNTICSMVESIEKINEVIELIESSINDVLDGTENELEKLIDENKGSDGDLIYEIYKVIQNDKTMISNFVDVYKKLNFGDITDEEIKEINSNNINLIKEYEFNKEYKKINYTNLAIDSYSNSIITAFADSLSSSALKMYTTVTINPELDIVGDRSSINYILEEKYAEAESKSDITLNYYNDLTTSSLLQDIYTKSCYQRQSMNNALNAYVSVPKHEDHSYVDLVMEVKDIAINKAFDSVEDIIKTMLLIELKKEDYVEFLSERQGIKNILQA